MYAISDDYGKKYIKFSVRACTSAQMHGLRVLCLPLRLCTFVSVSMCPRACVPVCLCFDTAHTYTADGYDRMCFYLSVCLPVQRSICLSLYLLTPNSLTHAFRIHTHHLLILSIHLSVCPSIYLLLTPSTYYLLLTPNSMTLSVHLPTTYAQLHDTGAHIAARADTQRLRAVVSPHSGL